MPITMYDKDGKPVVVPTGPGGTPTGNTSGLASTPPKVQGKGTNGTGTGSGTNKGSTTNFTSGNRKGFGKTPQVVSGKANKNARGQINVQDYSGQVAMDPRLGFNRDNRKTKGQNESGFMEDHLSSSSEINSMTQAGTIDQTGLGLQGNVGPVQNQEVAQVAPKQANSYDVQNTWDAVDANANLQGAVGTVSQGAQVDAAQIDMQGIGTGVNADGSVNYTGEALKKYAAQDMSNIIDTSTAAGKLLAQQLGDGNYVDSKATLKGQLDILQGEFVDAQTGEPKIPAWAAGTARNVSKIAAFTGMSGSAATAAMAQALMEASIPVAQADSQFFQTLTLQNLSNKQQSVINTANTLAKFEQTNVDNRMAAAIQNAKSFLEMDMANLSNEQQARVINNQERFQSILEDAKQENAKRLFVAGSQNDMDKFYDQLNTQISQYNSSQNLDASKFNATMEDSRQKFEAEMQYNIAISDAKWRQTVQLQEDTQAHEAATIDVKNMFDMSVNSLNAIRARSDALLDYAFRASESEKERNVRIALQQLAGDQAADASMMTGLGTIAGAVAGSDWFGSALKGIFS